MGLQAVRNGPGGPFLTGDHSAWNTGRAVGERHDLQITNANLRMPGLLMTYFDSPYHVRLVH